MNNILIKIVELREARNWSEYQLAERANIPQSTINSWYRKNMTPSISSLEKICAALDITLSQLFSKSQEKYDLTDEQITLLEKWSKLTEDQRKAIFELMDAI